MIYISVITGLSAVSTNITEEVYVANSIYPTYREELIERRVHQDRAVGQCYRLTQELQYAIETLPVDVNKYLRFAEMIQTEINLLKGWRKSDNKFKSALQEGNSDFVKTVAAYIKKYAPVYGIEVVSPIIAQAVLESGYGTSELAVNAHNYFGLKYREGRCKTCIGIYHMVGSEQNADGSYTSSAMQWCKFKDMENGVIGYFDFINIPNYKNLKGVTDPRKYLENIKADGYATSHKYVDNLMRVIETWHLTDYDKKEETKMSNSPLVVYTKLSPNHSGQRTHSIDRITPHCVVGQLSAESICGCFISTSRQASCNYGIGTDGRISMSVEEKNRSWCSSSRENDQRAVTIECASDKTAPYAFNDAVYASLVNLCVDICQRNGKSKLLWLGDKNKTLAYAPKSDEMVLTVHRWFANKSCPGDWLYNRLGNLAAEVTKRLTGGSTDTGKVDVPSDGKTLYRVQTGAFSKRSNADAWAAKLKAVGFDTYIVQMGNLYKVQVGAYSQKSNAENMMAKLKAAGYDAFITTKSGTAAGTAKKSAAEIAKEIYNGTCSDARWSSWGNGADRVNRLKQAGYDPSEVQSEVNKLF